MRGLLGKARDAAAGVASQCNTLGAGVVASAAQGASSLANANGELAQVLRQVTHSQSAAVPPEVLKDAVRLATESEEALGAVLRHIEENIAAPAQEWRRLNGALLLLERLLRRGRQSDGPGGNRETGLPSDDPLIGRIWFQVKLQAKLDALVDFEYAEDNRVALLVRRAAKAALAAAEANNLTGDSDDEASGSASRDDGAKTAGYSTDSRPESARSGASGSVPGCHDEPATTIIPDVVGKSSPRPTGPGLVVDVTKALKEIAAEQAAAGRGGDADNAQKPSQTKGGSEKTAPRHDRNGGEKKASSGRPGQATVIGNLRDATSALDALRDPGTRLGGDVTKATETSGVSASDGSPGSGAGTEPCHIRCLRRILPSCCSRCLRATTYSRLASVEEACDTASDHGAHDKDKEAERFLAC